ncbi:terminase large subunit domain-containing protein [Chitinibacter tainanensis]|uniref:terminase large subunit domain-containing protein n=1 Tax=Chitinibacter tainanensis TaxID=230667 RepID=UPI002355DDD4|nr:terminase family protein [Chitinibacter tainanensis]
MSSIISRSLDIAWRPQEGPQTRLITCPAFEVMFGGARGGGKTDAMLGEWAIHADRYGEHAKGVFFRHSLPQLEAAIARAKQIYLRLGARWKEQAKTFIWPNKATLKFRYLANEDDAENYQGHDYTRLYFEELTNWADPAGIFKVMATLRSGAGVPCRMRATANPGGPGHHWVKARYIDPAPAGYKPIIDPETGQARVFIPSLLGQNKILMQNDPNYAARLRMSGSAALVKAWLEGDWTVIEGAYFSEWSAARHVVKPFAIPSHWAQFRAFDWGSAKPFCCLWFAVSDGCLAAIPRGALVVYREWYGQEEGKPNVGLRLTMQEVAKGIIKRERGDKIEFGVADPAIFTRDGGPSIAETMMAEGVMWRRADNKRVAGWEQVHLRLKGDEDDDYRPMLYVFDTCGALIRTLPALQHDKNNAEDVDSDMEDHAPDTLRYGCMARMLINELPADKKGAPSPGSIEWILSRTKQKTQRSKYRA